MWLSAYICSKTFLASYGFQPLLCCIVYMSMYYLSISAIHSPLSSSYEAALLKALSPFEKAYISRSQTRLIDLVNQLFGVGSRTLPKEEEVLSAVKIFSR